MAATSHKLPQSFSAVDSIYWNKLPRHVAVVIDNTLLEFAGAASDSSIIDTSLGLVKNTCNESSTFLRRKSNALLSGIPCQPESSIHSLDGIFASMLDILYLNVSLGVEHLTLYDEYGVLKSHARLLLHLLETNSKLETGFEDELVATVRIMVDHCLVWDGKITIRSTQSKQREDVRDRLLEDFPLNSDPDLVYIIGGKTGFQLHNYCPWSIRLSEFHHVPSLDYYGRVDMRDIFQGMKDYSKCEQRFGK
ncbi:hypothetical protein BDEG_24771 [Batrachochytrium dendrobatidis JEL423]|uniref:ditrans,polycis-polyprenyl diphosphate synthase [(2E,6E)-farnesyldiphosphate specific] n=1 Tax=Batrachochytrium dendrobatidis (strain JEL423) TaxID=403673 RepID=A0A177WLY7_BATDL|nr:hypothetical protein BDEG_24771 [Batrachochytrium dendrobatidis JEL423]